MGPGNVLVGKKKKKATKQGVNTFNLEGCLGKGEERVTGLQRAPHPQMPHE